VYLKGFLRSYLKLVALPEEWAELALAGSSSSAIPPILPAAGAVARRVPWIERYKWAASYVVGTALALTAVHWLVSNTPQLGFPDAQRLAPLALEDATSPPADVDSAAATVPASTALPPLLPSTAPAASADEPPVMASLNPFRVVTEDREQVVAAASLLTLTFDQASWVDVRDQSGSKLAYQTVSAGEKRTFSAGAPLSILIGNARGVRADIAGTPVDLDTFVRGNIARFAVAEGEQGWKAVTADRDASDRDGG
jgi:cytoskeletal protein RodZ